MSKPLIGWRKQKNSAFDAEPYMNEVGIEEMQDRLYFQRLGASRLCQARAAELD
jgi:hypothetical protein